MRGCEGWTLISMLILEIFFEMFNDPGSFNSCNIILSNTSILLQYLSYSESNPHNGNPSPTSDSTHSLELLPSSSPPSSSTSTHSSSGMSTMKLFFLISLSLLFTSFVMKSSSSSSSSSSPSLPTPLPAPSVAPASPSKMPAFSSSSGSTFPAFASSSDSTISPPPPPLFLPFPNFLILKKSIAPKVLNPKAEAATKRSLFPFLPYP
uniref:Uncharacterized protein n=1 Tax=Arundo donax TaxID=35708 RepID=A0A0A9DJM1_ARUDO